MINKIKISELKLNQGVWDTRVFHKNLQGYEWFVFNMWKNRLTVKMLIVKLVEKNEKDIKTLWIKNSSQGGELMWNV